MSGIHVPPVGSELEGLIGCLDSVSFAHVENDLSGTSHCIRETSPAVNAACGRYVQQYVIRPQGSLSVTFQKTTLLSHDGSRYDLPEPNAGLHAAVMLLNRNLYVLSISVQSANSGHWTLSF